MIRMLKPKGLFIMTCATTGRPEHGTLSSDGGWGAPLLATEYYKNLTESDIRDVFHQPLTDVFTEFNFIVNDVHDLQFWGIKK